MEPGSLRVGEVAAGAGVHRETLRYYERRGLIFRPRPVEPPGIARTPLGPWSACVSSNGRKASGSPCVRSGTWPGSPTITSGDAPPPSPRPRRGEDARDRRQDPPPQSDAAPAAGDQRVPVPWRLSDCARGGRKKGDTMTDQSFECRLDRLDGTEQARYAALRAVMSRQWRRHATFPTATPYVSGLTPRSSGRLRSGSASSVDAAHAFARHSSGPKGTRCGCALTGGPGVEGFLPASCRQTPERVSAPALASRRLDEGDLRWRQRAAPPARRLQAVRGGRPR